MILLFDNGHGQNTPGKRSPDGRLLEWSYTRDRAEDVVRRLVARGYDARRIVTEPYDVSLAERCRRVKSICADVGARNVLLVSIHCNAAGADGRWHDAQGWSAFVCPQASQQSRRLAESLHDAARTVGLPSRRPLPTQKYWTMNLAICRGVPCPAVLTENLFQDNRADVDFLLSAAGREAVAQLHVDGIINYLNTL